ncbi:PEP-CTERM sorting domain-containing protein [Nodularia sp. UHCC 0506]|uniref:PEP-CTERM sorting domain-containing protein n=1 Tax=Nodularia sp. UHCC 0506 TaxID=3110243 RepID=UPI002B217D28|nr:PEP-CTERM sorting domain-containing protein [Nodularia sp. UHCC 0506]MEA5512647.1 PEP-CTERM sorting domain-containing protein [Nodularia sp. UHCC 0506]
MRIFSNKQHQILKYIGVSAIALIGMLNPGVANARGFVTQTKEFNLNFDFDPNGQAITSPNAGNPLGIGNQWEEWGVRISANVKNQPNRSEPLLLFNSNPNTFTGGDNDLMTGRSQWGTTTQNNVLIIQEDGWQRRNGQVVGVRNANDPDDESNGGWITFDFFDSPVNFKEFSLLDMDDDQDGRGNYLEVFLWDKDNNQFKIDALSLIQGHYNQYIAPTGNKIDGYQQSYTLGNVTITQDSKVRGDNSMYTFSTSYVDITKVQYRYPGSGAIAGLKWDKTIKKEVPEPSTGLGILLVSSAFLYSNRKRQQHLS